MTAALYLRKAVALPLHVAAARALRLGKQAAARRWERSRDLRRDTHGQFGSGNLARLVTIGAGDVPATWAAVLPELCARYRQNCFDLLGSGWVKVRYGFSAPGVEGHRYPPAPSVVADADGDWLAFHVTPANLAESRRLWRLVQQPYEPIDWQLDFKSGFRWEAPRHFRDQRFGIAAGADVKVPWELARLQHLPQLAIAHLMAASGAAGYEAPDAYATTVRNQVLDFLAANPPRFGVNWVCPMDVAIRAANILLAVDLLRTGGWEPDAAFLAAISRAAEQHARHIVANLEWSPEARGNHYLANLAGLAFCATYLPANAETDGWLAFAAHQFGVELPRQFLADGGNFEGSTNYHRLSTEIGLFGAALLLGVASERADAFAQPLAGMLAIRPPLPSSPAPSTRAADGGPLPLPVEAVNALSRAVDATAAWLKPTGRAPQVGDTDSGRLFKLHVAVQRQSEDGALREDVLDHRHLCAMGAALLTAEGAEHPEAGAWQDACIATMIARGRALAVRPDALAWRPLPAPDPAAFAALQAKIRCLPAGQMREHRFHLPGFRPERLVRHALPAFGLFVYRDERSYVALRCAEHPNDGQPTGHTHDDNLTLELHHDGVDLIADPGSYLYTALPERREQYRAASSHFAPRAVGHPATRSVGIFELRHLATARCIHFGPDGVAAVLRGPGWEVTRIVLLQRDLVHVLDGSSAGPLAPDRTANGEVNVSEGYGRATARSVRVL